MIRRSFTVAYLVAFTVAGWACSQPVAEGPPLTLPTEVIPDWINPTDTESLFSEEEECSVTVGDGVRILQVFEGTGAYGVLRAGDIVTSVDGVRTDSREVLLQVLRDRQPGELIRLAGSRRGNAFSVEVALSSVPDDPGRGIIGIFPETRLRVVPASSLPSGPDVDPVAEPVLLDGALLWYSPLTANWTRHAGVEAVRVVGFGSGIYAASGGETPALVELIEDKVVRIDPGPIVVESAVGPIAVLVGSLETVLAPVGELILVTGRFFDEPSGVFAIHAVDPIDGTLVWSRPIGLSASGLPLVPVEAFRSPSGVRSVVSLVEQDPVTGSRSAVLTYLLVDDQGEVIAGPPGIDRFLPTDGVTGWFDDQSLAYVAELAAPEVVVWNLSSGDHTRVWPVPAESVADLVTMKPIGDGRHMMQVGSREVNLIDVFQLEPVRPIARGCSLIPMNLAGRTELLPPALT